MSRKHMGSSLDDFLKQEGIFLKRRKPKPSRRSSPRLAEALIAQSCIDGNIPLITRDRDFRAYAEATGHNLFLT